MMSPAYKNMIFISFLFHPNFSTKSAGLPHFCRVNLDGIGLVKKPFYHVVGSLRFTYRYMATIGQNVFGLSKPSKTTWAGIMENSTVILPALGQA